MAVVSKKDTPTGDFHPFRDLTKTLEQFKVPGVDMSAFVNARRKDVEALTAANKAAYEALQDLGRTQTDMLTHAMKGMQESAEGMLREGIKGPTRPSRPKRLAWPGRGCSPISRSSQSWHASRRRRPWRVSLKQRRRAPRSSRTWRT